MINLKLAVRKEQPHKMCVRCQSSLVCGLLSVPPEAKRRAAQAAGSLQLIKRSHLRMLPAVGYPLPAVFPRAPCPMPHAPCSMLYALCSMPIMIDRGYLFCYKSGRKCQAHWWGSRTSNPVWGSEGCPRWVRFPCTSANLSKCNPGINSWGFFFGKTPLSYKTLLQIFTHYLPGIFWVNLPTLYTVSFG